MYNEDKRPLIKGLLFFVNFILLKRLKIKTKNDIILERLPLLLIKEKRYTLG
jgi:hypothetical protein